MFIPRQLCHLHLGTCSLVNLTKQKVGVSGQASFHPEAFVSEAMREGRLQPDIEPLECRGFFERFKER